MIGTRNLAASNQRRSATAATDWCRAARQALDILGDRAPAELKTTGMLRLQHPAATLAELGALHQPPITKDTAVGRLRRLLKNAGLSDRAAD